MKRPDRVLLVIVVSLITLLSVSRGLRREVACGLLAVLVVFLTLMVIWGRDFYRGRWLMRRREWARALRQFERCQRKLSEARFHRVLNALHLSLYTFDGIAVVLNNVAVCQMNLRDMPAATRALQTALVRDPGYAVPHLNLAIIAALAGNEASASEELAEATRLGYSRRGAQLMVRRALASVNTTLGEALKEK